MTKSDIFSRSHGSTWEKPILSHRLSMDIQEESKVCLAKSKCKCCTGGRLRPGIQRIQTIQGYSLTSICVKRKRLTENEFIISSFCRARFKMVNLDSLDSLDSKQNGASTIKIMHFHYPGSGYKGSKVWIVRARFIDCNQDVSSLWISCYALHQQ